MLPASNRFVSLFCPCANKLLANRKRGVVANAVECANITTGFGRVIRRDDEENLYNNNDNNINIR